MTDANKRDCKHGRLARSCEICDLETRLAAETRRREEAERERDDWMALAGQINADRISDNQMLAQRAEAAEARAEAMEKAAGDRAINALRAAMDDAGARDSQMRADVIGYFRHHWKAALARQEIKLFEPMNGSMSEERIREIARRVAITSGLKSGPMEIAMQAIREALRTVSEEQTSDRAETIERNPKSWAAWKREAERLQAELDALRTAPTFAQGVEAAARIDLLAAVAKEYDMSVDSVQAALRALSTAFPADGVSDSELNAMVSRFLAWLLPADFAPDCGITFTPHPSAWPIGTNLFTADQARDMLRYVLAASKERT